MRSRLFLTSSVLLAVVMAIPALADPPPPVSFAPPFTYYFAGQSCYEPLPSGAPTPCRAEDGRDVASSGFSDGTAHVHARLKQGTGEGSGLVTFVAYHTIAHAVDKIEYRFVIDVRGRAKDDTIRDAAVRADVGWVDSAGVSQAAPTVTLVAGGDSFDGTRIVKATFEPVDALGRPTGIAAGSITVSLSVTAYANAAPLERSLAEADVAVTDASYRVSL